MRLDDLKNLLFWLTIALFALSVLIIGLYFYHSRQRSNNYLGKKELKLRYFIQKQVDHTGALTGYECLLRQQQPDGSWQLPQQLETLPLQRVIFLLETTFKSLPTEAIQLSINLSYQQIISPEFDYFVRWAVSKITPMRLAVELNVIPNEHYYHKNHFLACIRRGRQYGMQFEIDHIGADNEDLNSIEWMMPVIDTLKCSMRSFRKKDRSQWLDLNLQFWNHFATEKHINLVLTGIENDEDEALAEQLHIDLRQGYRFGRPINPLQ